jgi:hypothetical protein
MTVPWMAWRRTIALGGRPWAVISRSGVKWWGLFLVAALVVGAMLIALYKETTSQRTERAAASLARACNAILREMRVPPPGGSSVVAEPDYSSSVTRALEPFQRKIDYDAGLLLPLGIRVRVG